jgi:hypothetical protein
LLLLVALALFAATASAPSGWKWDRGSAKADDGAAPAPTGWSWNEAQIVATGSEVTLAGDTSSIAVTPPAGAAPDVGDTVVVVDTGSDTLLGFPSGSGDISWTALGWSWND